ncbi:MAG: hypothetical protein GC180_12530 [Bacteroidetes bacterium]|nr:hypothetical protein [Bacteroidota bacterium]
MKFIPLTLALGGLFLFSHLQAQVADSTMLVDTLSNQKAPNEPHSRGNIVGSVQESKEEEENVQNAESLRLLRKKREERERIEKGLDELVAYPLNLQSDNVNSFQVLDSIADNNRFIFTGEDHRVEKFNTTLEMKMMQYLNTRGYNYYLMEAGWVTAWMLNRYIVDGDSAAEQILSTYYSKNFFNMFRGFHQNNDTLEDDHKIRAVGLDIERDAPLALRTLLYLLPEKQAPDSLEMFVESLKILSNIHIEQAKEYAENAQDDGDMFDFGGYEFEYNEYDDEEDGRKYFYFNMINTIKDLTSRFHGKEEDFKSYLGPNYADFARVIHEMENWLIWIGYEKEELPQSWVYRELYMDGNFREMFKDKPEAKGFGQFGRCHITRVTKVGDCGFAFFSSLNKRIITKMPELKNQLASIGVFYGGLDKDNKANDNGNVDDLIRHTGKGEVNLFIDLNDYGDEMLRSKFSAIIIVKSKHYREHMSRNEEDELNEEDAFDDLYISPDFNVVFRNFNMDAFNKATNFGLKTPVSFLEYGLSVKTSKMTASFQFGNLSGYNKNTDSSHQHLSGWNFRYTFGRDLIAAKWLNLTPEMGIGFVQLTYTEENLNAPKTQFKTSYVTKYRNPAFLIDGRLNLGIVVGQVEFRGLAGYTIDVSHDNWRQNGQLLSGGPTTKFTSWYYGAGISVLFNGN